ncbi:MAG: hypothetical protein NTW89_08380 [Burkholderiales bacterium]|nr:hypothetical protein [Burkholderiales bacterium]
MTHDHSHDHSHHHAPHALAKDVNHSAIGPGVVLAPPALASSVLSGVGQRILVIGVMVCAVWLAVLWAL